MPRGVEDRDGRRLCRDCQTWKPLDEFCVSSKRPPGRGSYCKECLSHRSKASYAKRVQERQGRTVRSVRQVPDGHRYCPDCEQTKPVSAFPRHRNDSGGRGRYCKPCHNVRGKESKQRLYGGSREHHLRERYGITGSDFDEMLAAQEGRCAICGAPGPNTLITIIATVGCAGYCASTATAASGSSRTTRSSSPVRTRI